MTDADGSESWAYDRWVKSRWQNKKRTTNNIPKPTDYTYNLKGYLATLTYPSGRVITYTTDSAGRPSASSKTFPIIFSTCKELAPTE